MIPGKLPSLVLNSMLRSTIFGLWVLLFSIGIVSAQSPPGTGYKPIVYDTSYHHNKWGVIPADLVYHFAAYTTSFDSDDDDNGDGVGDRWAIPHWVAYEIKQDDSIPFVHYNRPKWMTDDTLNIQRIAPSDASYAVSGTNQLKEVPTNSRYVRGHMCPKMAADKISANAGFNTHTVLNAIPQLQWQNNGIWKALELDIMEWANTYGSVWVVCGPVFFNNTPAVWLGQNDEVKVAVPDALFKIIIREEDNPTGIESLAFVFPNIIPTTKDEYYEFLTGISRIETITGLSFLTSLDVDVQLIEKSKNDSLILWLKKDVVNNW
jgi:endonuclease G, mitochondrial